MEVQKSYIQWVVGFIALNFAATMIMQYSGEYIGDLRESKIASLGAIWISFFLLSFMYVFFLLVLFPILQSIKIRQLKFPISHKTLGRRIGVILVILQIFFFFFNQYYNVNTAGSNLIRTNSVLSLFWVLVPVDMLFLIYYAIYRDSKYFKWNVLIWLISNLSRGWAGVFVFVIFFEWCRLSREKKINSIKVIIGIFLVLLLYPLLSIFKWIMRTPLSVGESKIDVASEVIERNLRDLNYFELIYSGIEHIVARLQMTSVIAETYRLRDVIEKGFETGEFTSYWFDGLHGVVISRVFSLEREMNLSVALTKYFEFSWSFEVGNWNINPSIVSWFIIKPENSVLFVVYLIAICSLSVFFMKIISKGKRSMDLVWITWMLYLIPFWNNTFVNFIYSMLVFLAMKLFATYICPIEKSFVHR